MLPRLPTWLIATIWMGTACLCWLSDNPVFSAASAFLSVAYWVAAYGEQMLPETTRVGAHDLTPDGHCVTRGHYH